MTRISTVVVAVLIFFTASVKAADSLIISNPVSRIVMQRDMANKAVIRINGSAPEGTKQVKARLVAREKGQGNTTKWTVIDESVQNGSFSGTVTGTGGWYDLEVCAIGGNGKKVERKVERVGIGEVFVIVGHSVAHGGDINLGGPIDDRVNTIAVNEHSELGKEYNRTGDTAYLPFGFVHADSGVAYAPFGHNSYFWSKFGDLLVKKTKVPVLMYNAAFGGTSLAHWAKSAKSIQFEHGFVKSQIRMPYINLRNALIKYIPLTGIRALLADQGQNDNQEKSADTIFKNYKIFLEEARRDLSFDSLTIVVNRQAPPHAPQIRRAQEAMLREPFTYPGPDYDKGLQEEDRYDKIHLSKSGLEKAAVLWSEALDEKFFDTVQPFIPEK